MSIAATASNWPHIKKWPVGLWIFRCGGVQNVYFGCTIQVYR